MDSISPPQYWWSDLPSDLLNKISICLQSSRLDILRFRGVCHSWRNSSSTPFPPKIPSSLKLPFPSRSSSEKRYVTLNESTLYYIQPLSNPQATPWLMRIKFSESGNPSVEDLLSQVPVLGETEKVLHLPRVLDLMDFRVGEICNDYYIKIFGRKRSYIHGRVAVSSSFSNIGDGVTVMTVTPTGLEFAVWRTGDDKWTIMNNNIPGSGLFNVVYLHGKFYAFAGSGLVVTIDPDSLKMRQVAPAKQEQDSICYLQCLVDLFGDLFGVFKCKEANMNEMETSTFQVEKLDQEKHRWVKAGDELKDRLIFIGNHYSFSVWAKDFPGYQANCIYFNDLFV